MEPSGARQHDVDVLRSTASRRRRGAPHEQRARRQPQSQSRMLRRLGFETSISVVRPRSLQRERQRPEARAHAPNVDRRSVGEPRARRREREVEPARSAARAAPLVDEQQLQRLEEAAVRAEVRRHVHRAVVRGARPAAATPPRRRRTCRASCPRRASRRGVRASWSGWSLSARKRD